MLSEIQRKIYNFTYMWNLRKNEQAYNRNRINTENKLVIAKRMGVGNDKIDVRC